MASRNPTIEMNVERIRGIEERYARLVRENTRYEADGVEDAEVLLVAFGSVSRICREAIEDLRAAGIKIGLIRPITLVPFPYEAIGEAARQSSVRKVVVVEMSTGQMVEDVRLAVNGAKPVDLLASYGSQIPLPDEIREFVSKSLAE